MNKQLIFISIILIISMIFSGCTRIDEPNNDKQFNVDEKQPTIKTYYPFKENMKKKYEGIGNEFAEQTTFIEFIQGNRAQIKIFNPGTVAVKVVEYNEGEIREIFSEGEFY